MNPLGLDEKRFLVATNLQGQLTAFGQLEPKPDPDRLQFHELRTLIVSKDARSAQQPIWASSLTALWTP